ncbi:Fc.00g024610.m01.CDS01 [Cosmosporella sp. VM-42]
MAALANTTSPILNPDKNPLLRFFLKKTFYAQFCAGENPIEVKNTITGLKNIGFTGVILGYAKEVVLTSNQAESLTNAGEETEECIRDEIIPWTEGTLETVRLAEPGDFVALKFTGAGRLALYQLRERLPASPALHKSIDSICQLAHERGVRLLFDAEQDVLQDGIDDWTIEFARKYNKDAKQAVIYGTYQAYKKACPEVVSRHLAIAQNEGFALGVKLVRGAYLLSDPRHLFHDTQEGTDACYNGIAASVLTQTWGHGVKGEGKYPASSIVLATHNAESVRRARAICDAGAAKSDVAFAQLQGMADEVSCELVEAGQSARQENPEKATGLPAYKYLVWGTTGECMKYLLRRAYENKDAVQRTRGGRDAMWGELVRRCKSVVGLA